MELRIRSVFAGIFFIMLLASCQNETKPAEAQAEKPKVDTIRVEPVSREGADTYTITEGLVYWIGKKAVGEGHHGEIAVTGGELLVKDGKILSGSVKIDMNTIAVVDLKDQGERRDLESHLKDADFFEVNKFPTAEYTFDEVLPSVNPDFNATVLGKLTMKGKTHPVNVTLKFSITGDELVAESSTFPINRTQWGVNFRSGILGTAKDKLINDTVPLSFKIKAKKK